MSDEDLEETIREAASGPASASNDGQAATARSLDELIKADEYLANKKVAGKRKPGIRWGKFVSGDSQ